MSGFFNVASFALGLVAWIVPVVTMSRRAKYRVRKAFGSSVISFTACSLSLTLQFFEIKSRVHIEDWSALMDTIDALAVVVVVLVGITVLLNAAVWLVCKE